MRFVFRFFVSGFFLLIATCHTVLLLNAQQRWIVRESNTNQNLNAIHLPRPGAARLSLATLLGQEIAVVANMTLQGKIDIPFNVSSLSQGVYVYRLEYDGAFYTGKIIVAR